MTLSVFIQSYLGTDHKNKTNKIGIIDNIISLNEEEKISNKKSITAVIGLSIRLLVLRKGHSTYVLYLLIKPRKTDA